MSCRIISASSLPFLHKYICVCSSSPFLCICVLPFYLFYTSVSAYVSLLLCSPFSLSSSCYDVPLYYKRFYIYCCTGPLPTVHLVYVGIPLLFYLSSLFLLFSVFCLLFSVFSPCLYAGYGTFFSTFSVYDTFCWPFLFPFVLFFSPFYLYCSKSCGLFYLTILFIYLFINYNFLTSGGHKSRALRSFQAASLRGPRQPFLWVPDTF